MRQEVADAQKIRNRILSNFEVALEPGVSDAERSRLLHTVIVGGGPTGVEFGAELYDFVLQVSMCRWLTPWWIRHNLRVVTELYSCADVRKYCTRYMLMIPAMMMIQSLATLYYMVENNCNLLYTSSSGV